VGELVAGMKPHLKQFSFMFDSDAGKKLHEAKFLKVSFEKAYAWMGWKPTLAFEETVAWTAEGYHGDFPAHVSLKIDDFSSRLSLGTHSAGRGK
jgi:hypothetical protein